ncbi:MAG: hypothetical protein KDF58_05955 [Alphaproteobacteria bacterium]|nr:hypothetical protein [Alphaproteobacteria bacterium]HPF45358.1 hypothetical protein [Emcibacteraceae bacterium]
MFKNPIFLTGAFVIVAVIGYFLGVNSVQDQVVEKIPKEMLLVEKSGEFNVPTPETEAQSVIWTNIGPSNYQLQDVILAFPIQLPIYDLAYTNYSNYYANKYGYPESHVIEMPEHVHLIEYRMKTIGMETKCYLNMLIDKNIGLNLPNEVFVSRMKLPADENVGIVKPKREEGWKETEEIKENRIRWTYTGAESRSNEKYLLRNAAMSGVNINADTGKVKGRLMSVSMLEYNPNYYPDLDYFNFQVGCSILAKEMQLKDEFSIWIKKKSGRDYSKIVNLHPEDFVKFKIPHSTREKIVKFFKTVPLPLYPKQEMMKEN